MLERALRRRGLADADRRAGPDARREGPADSDETREALRAALDEFIADANGGGGGGRGVLRRARPRLDAAAFARAYDDALERRRRFADGRLEIGARALAWARERELPVVLIAGETHVIHERRARLGHPRAGGRQRRRADPGRLLPGAGRRAAAAAGALGGGGGGAARRGRRRPRRRRLPAAARRLRLRAQLVRRAPASTTSSRTSRTPCSRATATAARPATSRACRRSCTPCEARWPRRAEMRDGRRTPRRRQCRRRSHGSCQRAGSADDDRRLRRRASRATTGRLPHSLDARLRPLLLRPRRRRPGPPGRGGDARRRPRRRLRRRGRRRRPRAPPGAVC